MALFLDVPRSWPIPADALHAMIIYFSHLLADMLTPAGVPLLWLRWRFRLPLLNSAKATSRARAVSVPGGVCHLLAR